MNRAGLAALAVGGALLLTGCGGEGPVTDDEASAFIDVARDQLPGASNYTEDQLTAMATQVCQVLQTDGTTAADAVGVMDNYSALSTEEQTTIVGLAAGSACPEQAAKVAPG